MYKTDDLIPREIKKRLFMRVLRMSGRCFIYPVLAQSLSMERIAHKTVFQTDSSFRFLFSAGSPNKTAALISVFIYIAS